MRRTLFRNLLCLLVVSVCHIAAADVLVVTNALDEIANPPLGSLRKTIADAQSGDTIQFAPEVVGTITLAGAELILDKNLTITGPGASTLAISGNAQSRIFSIPPATTCTISGLTIRNGKAPNATSTDIHGGDGGGILSAGTLALSDCVLTGNGSGDGFQNSGGNGGSGGAICSKAGSLSLTRCSVIGNFAGKPIGFGGNGGSGGGIHVEGDFLLEKSCVANNVAGPGAPFGGNGGAGGGLFISSSSATLHTSTISGNTAGLGYSKDTTRQSAGSGGGIATSQSIEIISCTITKNVSGTSQPDPSSYFLHPTPGDGGGILGAANIKNTIVAGNRVPSNAGPYAGPPGKGPDLFGTFASEGHNFVGNSADSTGFTAGQLADIVGSAAAPIDPKLAPLANNGGLTQTHSFALASPAIDAGDDSITGTDQRGAPRLAEAHVDIGAFESDVSVFTFAVPESEISESAGNVTVSVRRSQHLNSSATLQFSTFAASAIAGSDFTGLSGALNFAAGQAEAFITIPILQDALFEGPETFSVVLASPSGNPLIGPIVSHKVTIHDDDAARFDFAVTASSVNEAGGSAIVTVVRSQNISDPASVQFSTTSESALAGTDFTGLSGAINFAAGQTEAFITIPILQDTLLEGPESFLVQLASSGANSIIGPVNSQKITILDDEISPKFEFEVTTSSVNETGGHAVVTVVRSQNISNSASVSYTTANGSATAGGDYTATSGTLNFPAGLTTKTISVPILNDSVVESDESFTIQLSEPSTGAILGGVTTHTVTIVSDDVPPTLSFEVSSSEVAEASGNVFIKIKRTGLTSVAVGVSYQTNSVTAVSGLDFTPVSGTIQFPDGVTEQTLVIPILNDDVIEIAETFTVTLSSPTNSAVLGENATHTVTILNDDGPASVAFATSATSVNETAGTASIVVSRVGNPYIPFTVTISSSAGSAAAGSDFASVSQTLSFPAGTTSVTVPVSILDDATHEETETFTLRLTSPSNDVSLGVSSTHEITILDNDPQIPTVLNATYRGLVESADELERGHIVLTTNKARRVTGVVYLHGKKLRIRGSVAEDRTITQFLPARPNRLLEGGTLTLRLNGDSKSITGSFSRADSSNFELLAKRDKVGTRKAPVAETGVYTNHLTPTSGASTPTGFLRVTVNAAGRVALSGVLPDGTAVSASSNLADDGSFPFFAPCYAEGQGLAGITQITLYEALSISGQHHWSKPPTRWQTGFQNTSVEMVGAKYSPPKRARILDDYNATAGAARFKIETMLGQNPLEVPLLWNESNGVRALASTPSVVRVSMQPRTGLFKGTLVDESGSRRSFRGACIQQPGSSADLAAGLYVIRQGHASDSRQVKIEPAVH